MHGNSLSCCGWEEISGLSGWRKSSVKRLLDGTTYGASRIGSNRCGAVLFTANRAAPNYATRFADFIRKHELGTVVPIPTFTNPNTGNTITSFVWIINHAAVRRYKHEASTPKRKSVFGRI